MRVGVNRGDFSEENLVVASGITDGGFQDLQLTTGDVVTFTRNGANPWSGYSDLVLNEIKLYETANLLQEQQGKIQITANTSASLTGYEPINLL